MAELSIEQALEQGIQHHEAGRLAEAEALYRWILSESPDDADVCYLLGLVSGQLGRYEVATELIQKAITLLPPDAGIFNNLGEFYRRWGKMSEAIGAYRQAIALREDYPEALNNLGLALMESGGLDEAADALRRAIALDPGLAEPHLNLGNALWRKGDVEGAIPAYRRALVLKGQDPMVHYNLGNALRGKGLIDEAAASFRQAIALAPDYMEAHLALSGVLLATGEFREGWEEYEWRFARKEYSGLETLAGKTWDGSLLQGRTILLRGEQGLGDTIQFSRYASLVAKGGGRVVLACQKELVPLLRGIEGASEVVDYGGTLPAFDVHCWLLSVPRVLGTTVATIPASAPYLFVSDESAARWRRELEGLRGFKVGIAWQGSAKNPFDNMRSIPLASFEALSRVAGVTLVSLQKGPGANQIVELKDKFAVVDLGERLDGAGPFADTPAVMKNLDLVITVDTAVCHLAGALGVPVWNLLSFAADWRWLKEEERSPWYPTMRLFRQPSYGDWESVMERVRQALAERVARG